MSVEKVGDLLSGRSPVIGSLFTHCADPRGREGGTEREREREREREMASDWQHGRGRLPS